MKKITLLALSLVASASMIGQSSLNGPGEITPGANSDVPFYRGAPVVLTQSLDPVTVDTGGVACWDNVGGEYRDNAFYRVYKLDDFGITGDFMVSSLEWGQGSADSNNQLGLNLYLADTDDLGTATLTLLDGTTHSSDPADDLSLVSAPLSTTVPQGSILVFEVFAPDGGTALDVKFFPGFNSAGENDDSYLKSDGCSISAPATTTSIGFPDNQYVMNVVGDIALSTSDRLSDLIGIYPNPTTNILNVNVPSNIEVNSASLYDVLGKNTGVQLVNGQMNTSNLSRGVYILNIDTAEGTLTQKIVKQ